MAPKGSQNRSKNVSEKTLKKDADLQPRGRVRPDSARERKERDLSYKILQNLCLSFALLVHHLYVAFVCSFIFVSVRFVFLFFFVSLIFVSSRFVYFRFCSFLSVLFFLFFVVSCVFVSFHAPKMMPKTLENRCKSYQKSTKNEATIDQKWTKIDQKSIQNQLKIDLGKRSAPRPSQATASKIWEIGSILASLERFWAPFGVLGVPAGGPKIDKIQYLSILFGINFRHQFLDAFFLYFLIFDSFWIPFWLHFGIVFDHFCITFSSIDFASIFYRFFTVFGMPEPPFSIVKQSISWLFAFLEKI